MSKEKPHSTLTKFGRCSLDELHLLGIALSSSEGKSHEIVKSLEGHLASKDYWIYTRSRYTELVAEVTAEIRRRGHGLEPQGDE